jgi:hypothetical protein
LRKSTWAHDFGTAGEAFVMRQILDREAEARGESLGMLESWTGEIPIPPLEHFHALLDIAHDRMFGDTEGDLELMQYKPRD